MSWSLLLLAFVAGWQLLGRASPGQEFKARVSHAPGGPSSYVPGKWGTLQLQLTNLADQPADLFAATFFEERPAMQFCRQSWVPAKSRLQITHPILMPVETSPGIKGFNFRTLLLDPRQDDEVLVRGIGGNLQLQGVLRQADEAFTTIVEFPHEEPVPGSELTYELVVAARFPLGLSRNVSHLSQTILPASQEAYDAIDHLIIGESRVASDGPAMTAIRRWLYDGGHLWVMLDRVEPRLLEILLGDELNFQVVDRVDLTTVRIEPAANAGPTEVTTRDYDRPVSMVRLLVSDVEVAYSVNGWPAAFWKQCGEGKLLVTTLGPDGWMEQGLSSEQQQRPVGMPPSAGQPGEPRPPPRTAPPPPPPATAPADPQLAALLDGAKGRTYVALPAMENLAFEFFSVRSPPLLPATALESHVQEYVGNSVPSRWLISGLLAGFSAILAALGIVMWISGRLEWAGAAGTALALGVSVILLSIGFAQRRSVPPTVAKVQFIEPLPGTDDFQASGLMGIFAPDASKTIFASQGGGWGLPDRFDQSGQTVRLVWTDFDTWNWKNLPPISGLRTASFATSGSSGARIEARATFGPEGLIGHLSTGTLAAREDAVLATRHGRIGVDLAPDGSFRILASDVFSSEQFLASNLVSDEQNRRRRTLMNLLANPDRPDYPPDPKLLVWTDPADLRFQFDDSYRSLGAALVAVPLALERPPAGTEVAIASPFLPYRAVTGPDGLAPTGLWDFRRREWQDRSLPSSAWLRFQVPSVLLPLEALHGRVTVQVAGPVGKLELVALRGKETVLLKTWMDPVGTLSLDITDPALLQISEEGGLLLKVSGGDPARPHLTKSSGKTSYWRIESLRLELQARTAESGPLSANVRTEIEKEQ